MMGVKGLQTFLERYTTYACYKVDIATLANDYTTKTGKQAKIVVDTLSCFPMWYPNWGWFAIYEVQEFIMRARAFVESFRRLNVELIFFFGGLNIAKTGSAWLTVQEGKIADIHKAIDCLVTGRHFPTHGFKPPVPIPAITTDYILKYVLGCEVRTALCEFRQGVMEYALENECFAIFTEDTDFVVSQMDAMVLSAHHFSIENMSTLAYDRKKLAHKLGIRTDELPLLALLAGNDDLVQFVEIDEFHHRLCPGPGLEVPIQVLMPSIAHYIHKIPKETPIERVLLRLAMDIFRDSSQVALLKSNYDSYFLPDTSVSGISNSAPSVSTRSDTRSKVLLQIARERYQKVLLPFHAYSVFSEQTLLYGPSFEDVRIVRNKNVLTRDLPSSTVLRPLRAKLYGILLWEKHMEKPFAPIAVQEWCYEHVNSYEEPSFVKPVKPQVHHPGLLALWSDDESMNDTRWTLFLTTISPSLKTIPWRTFNDEFLLSTLAVYHLYTDTRYLNEIELDAVLVTIATFPLYDAEKLSSIEYGHYVSRTSNIIITLNRTFGLVLTILAACGFPVTLSENNAYIKFEMKVFQRKYFDLVQRKASIMSLCENNDECFELFNRMKDLITRTQPRVDKTKLSEDVTCPPTE